MSATLRACFLLCARSGAAASQTYHELDVIEEIQAVRDQISVLDGQARYAAYFRKHTQRMVTEANCAASRLEEVGLAPMHAVAVMNSGEEYLSLQAVMMQGRDIPGDTDFNSAGIVFIVVWCSREDVGRTIRRASEARLLCLDTFASQSDPSHPYHNNLHY